MSRGGHPSWYGFYGAPFAFRRTLLLRAGTFWPRVEDTLTLSTYTHARRPPRAAGQTHATRAERRAAGPHSRTDRGQERYACYRGATRGRARRPQRRHSQRHTHDGQTGSPAQRQPQGVQAGVGSGASFACIRLPRGAARGRGGRGGGPGAGGGGGAQGRAPHISVRADGPARGLISQTHPTTNENSSSKVCSTISDFTRLRPAVRPPTPGSAAGSPLHCARRSAQLPRPAGGGSTGGARRRRRRGRARGRGRRAVRRAA